MQLNTGYLETVVALGVPVDAGGSPGRKAGMYLAGTGFLYGTVSSGRGKRKSYKGWLVTCEHVLRGIEKYGELVVVRFNLGDGEGMTTFTLGIRESNVENWHRHPTQDVAVTPAGPSVFNLSGMSWNFFRSDSNTYDRKAADKAGLCEGDRVFMLGFPEGWRAGRQDYPVVRHGVLAQTRGWFNQDHQTFLVDGSGFEGNSGGPVVTGQELVTLGKWGSLKESKLVGMVSGVTDQPAKTEEADRQTHVGDAQGEDLGRAGGATILEKTDLIEVVPVDAIDETIRMALESQ